MATKKVTNVLIRMYRMGTGDCFAIKFRSGRRVLLKMLIDAGVVSGQKKHVQKYIENLHDWFKGEIDVFAVTHEHADHVSAIQKCEELFRDKFKIGKVWLAWTEDNDDSMAKEWKDIMGKKKNALKFASDRLRKFVKEDIGKQHEMDFNLDKLKKSSETFSESLDEFQQLHGATTVDSELKGMKILKEIAKDNIEYFEPGDKIDIGDITIKKDGNDVKVNARGFKFYFLGPPRDLNAIKKEHGKSEGEAYEHNKELDPDEFLSFALKEDAAMEDDDLPFSDDYVDFEKTLEAKYTQEDLKWRRIDHDWLQSAGQLAMRLTTGINNLSLVMAMEFEATKKVLLFPGDAEIGSWESWHKIKWEDQGLPKDFTTRLLNRTAFYKVAHHLSHNGTAKKDGLEKMTHKDLVAMATLSYNQISSRWTGTMPNRGILKELIQKTQGRLILTSMDKIFYDLNDTFPLKDKVDKERARFKNDNKFFFKDFKNFKNEHEHQDKVLYYEIMIRD